MCLLLLRFLSNDLVLSTLLIQRTQKSICKKGHCFARNRGCSDSELKKFTFTPLDSFPGPTALVLMFC
jgi:hypothetical protein